MALNLEFTFDDKTYRHYMNGFMTVMHCHHYMTLLTKLAKDLDDVGGTAILKESAEDSIRPVIEDYCVKNDIYSFQKRLDVGKEYYSVMGMGKMEVSGDEQGGEVSLSRSHVDQGWIKKWGENDESVNFWTCGYISAMFAAAASRPARSYEVVEENSMVMGSEASKFLVKAK